MMRHRFLLVAWMLSILILSVSAQRLMNDMEYRVEMQASLSDGNTPLWLNANRYGLSSLEEQNGYLRTTVVRPLAADSLRRWGVGYGVDVAATWHHSSRFIVQQCFAELRWLKGVLTVGSRYYPMELKNNRLSSGSQTLGINARPVPQVRLALPDYWTLPIFNGWLHLKGHVAYGKMTDDNWQHDFTQRKSKYADDVLYHSKAGYLKIGNDEVFCPFSVEMGLEMASTFGGTAYRPKGDGTMEPLQNATGLKAFWQAFVPGGGDVNETTYRNMEGNQLGSWLLRINYDNDTWGLSTYADKYFEDHSAMFQLDYDGYGEGDEWDKSKKRRYFMYDFKDMMVGLELRFHRSVYIRNVVLEYLYTKYQSGPIYHDHTPSMSDHVSGQDDFYNHSIFTGWQHWGQVMGNPLYLSPIYNSDGNIMVKNNRFQAIHLGVDGIILPQLYYRALFSWQDGVGTYKLPYTKNLSNTSFMVEADYHFTRRLLKGWGIRGAYGMDFGKIRGDNAGFQLTVTKCGRLF